jgi:3-phosphoshikimate 1-carboxyvinyltransferase
VRLAVVGTGLIGSSFALAARREGLFDEVVGVEPDPERGRQALSRRIVDTLADTVPLEVDAVVLAGPSHTVAPWVARLAEHPAVLLDTASVKGAVVDEVRAACPRFPPRFVPCHPLAGSEQSGPAAASATLFSGAEVIITPVAETDADALTQVSRWWRALGARVRTMTAAGHDDILAVTSHLPHLLAFAYLQQIDPAHVKHAAGGFRDFTRIGAADASMWAPIFQLNRPALLMALDRMDESLDRVRALLDGGDEAALRAFIQRAGVRREGADDG